MSNDGFSSTLEQFEKSMDIKPFDIEDTSSSVLPDFSSVELSFEDDELSFDSDDNIIENNVEEDTCDFKLTLNYEDTKKVLDWLQGIKFSTENKSIRQYCDTVAWHVKKKDITYDDLYKKLEKIKRSVES